MRRVAKRLWPSARTDSERVMRAIAGRVLPRKCLNRLYDGFSDRRRRVFHARFAKIFRDHRPPVAPGTWRVRFAGREVRIPLGRETMWLDWDCALSVLGHDAELKATYAALLASDNPPRCVFDVGANYGVHSLLLLAHGVQVFSFEPNPRCHQFSRRLEIVNDVAFILEATAMGAECGMVELAYPETETWLGTTSTEVASALAAEHELYRVQVPCTTLDAYVDRENSSSGSDQARHRGWRAERSSWGRAHPENPETTAPVRVRAVRLPRAVVDLLTRGRLRGHGAATALVRMPREAARIRVLRISGDQFRGATSGAGGIGAPARPARRQAGSGRRISSADRVRSSSARRYDSADV